MVSPSSPCHSGNRKSALGERRLVHREEAEQFYDQLKQPSMKVRVGMEASGHARWFERLLHHLQFQLWIGDAAEIRTKRARKQKTDRQDAQLLLRLMMGRPLSADLVADAENRDLRQLLWHRHRLVQMPTPVMNQRHVIARNEGLRRKTFNSEPRLNAQLIYESEMALFPECMLSCAQRVLDIANIVRDGDLSTANPSPLHTPQIFGIDPGSDSLNAPSPRFFLASL